MSTYTIINKNTNNRHIQLSIENKIIKLLILKAKLLF